MTKKQAILLTILMLIIMRLFTNTDKLQNYNTFQSMVFDPLTEQIDNKSFQVVGIPTETLDIITKPTPSTKSTENKVELKKGSEYVGEDLKPKSSLQQFRDSYQWQTPVEVPENYYTQQEKLSNFEDTDTTDTRNMKEYDLMKIVQKRIIGHETGGKRGVQARYSALNPYTGKDGGKGSGAYGAYQFIRHWDEPNIKKVLGITMDQFLGNRKAQDKFYEWKFSNVFLPELRKTRKEFPNLKLTDADIIQGMHFRGPAGFRDVLRSGQMDTKLEKHNPTVIAMLKNARKFEKMNLEDIINNH